MRSFSIGLLVFAAACGSVSTTDAGAGGGGGSLFTGGGAGGGGGGGGAMDTDAGHEADAGAVDAGTPDAGTPDAGQPASDGGFTVPDAGTPTSVSVTTGSCAMVTPCAGALEGTWFITAACADDPLADFRQACSSVTTVSNTSTLTGRLDFVGAQFNREVATTYATTVNLPAACASLGCSTVQSILRTTVPTATCTTAGSGRTGCDCSLSGSATFSERGTWTSTGGVVTLISPNKTRTFDTCEAAASLKMRETTSGLTGTERGTTTLTKQ
jgi:hypothetical protein